MIKTIAVSEVSAFNEADISTTLQYTWCTKEIFRSPAEMFWYHGDKGTKPSLNISPSVSAMSLKDIMTT